jgi:hypothetical protein
LTEGKNTQIVINYDNLLLALSNKFKESIISATYNTKKLHGGTVGQVLLVTGLARFKKGNEEVYKVVLKKQVKWERYGDVNSWRREYDLYHSNLEHYFDDDFSWPKCYLTIMHDDSFEIWMDYIDGPSGESLTIEMYCKAAEALGRFQGKLYEDKQYLINQISNLSSKDYVKNFYLHYSSWNEVYDYIRSDRCELPKHLCQMLIDLDSNRDKVFKYLSSLPTVLCHRDYWNTNIFYVDDKIIAIDWDTTGYGYFGEDIASLIADETSPSKMIDYFKACIPAYINGFNQYVDVKIDLHKSIHYIILMMFGYRLVEAFKFSDNQNQKNLALNSLQSIFEMQKIMTD